MDRILWTGTVDNLDLQGIANGDSQPMRVSEDADGRLITEFLVSAFTDSSESAVSYGDDWYACYQTRFRDMNPAPDAALLARMDADKLIESEPSAIIRAARDAYESARDAHHEAMPEAALAYEFYRCFAGDADDAPEFDPELPEVMPEEFRREYERMCVESEVR